jgi:hypothetical protein
MMLLMYFLPMLTYPLSVESVQLLRRVPGQAP